MNPATINADTQTEKIFAWRCGFNAMHLIDVGVEVGLFKALAAAPSGLSSAALAQQLNLNAHFVNVWCTTAYSFELLDANEASHEFKLAPFIDKILATPGHPRYLGGYVKLGTEFATEDFRGCVESFRTGRTMPFQGRGDKFARTIADGTMGVQVLSARKILPELSGLADKLGKRSAPAGNAGTDGHRLGGTFAYAAARDLIRASLRSKLSGIETESLGERRCDERMDGFPQSWLGDRSGSCGRRVVRRS